MPQTAEGNILHQHNLISKGRHFYFFSCSVITEISPKCVNRQVIAMNKTPLSDSNVSPPKREHFHYVVLN